MLLPVAILPLQLGYAQALTIPHLCRRPTRINQQSFRLARKRNATVHLKSCPDSGQSILLSAEPNILSCPNVEWLTLMHIARHGNPGWKLENIRSTRASRLPWQFIRL